MKTADFQLQVPLMSKARPRTAPGHARPYMPKPYMEWKARVRAILGEWWTHPPLDEINCLVLTFRGPGRGDLDNLQGAVLDAGNGVIWCDDRVTVIRAIAARWEKAPTTNQSIYMKVIWQC